MLVTSVSTARLPAAFAPMTDPASTAQPAAAALWDTEFLTELRRDMTRFAELQLRDRASAEDAVQEALADAMAGARQFAGRSAVKTWVLSILRHKIIDQIRSRTRTINISSLAGDTDDGADDFDALFTASGHWRAEDIPRAWADPEASLSQQQFWAVFDVCLHDLPDNTARVFMMREHLGFDTPEICQTLGISSNNCWVILHRARMQLRLCLEKRWFGADVGSRKEVR